MKKSVAVMIVIIVLIVIVVGAFAIFHKSKKPATTASTTSTSSQSSSAAINNAVLVTKTNSSLGQYLAEPNGDALYTYGGDSAGKSNCTGSCLSTWPAYQDKGAITGLPTNVNTITRSDNGQAQYTYKGRPLYTFVGDGSGQVTGNGVSNFEIARP